MGGGGGLKIFRKYFVKDYNFFTLSCIGYLIKIEKYICSFFGEERGWGLREYLSRKVPVGSNDGSK